MSRASVQSALDWIAPHCDIIDRLNDVPPSARVRGLYFRSVRGVLERLGRASAYDEFFPGESWSSLAFYPLGDYLVRLALAGAIVTTPAKLHEGIYQITRQNASAFATSLLGQVLVRILARDPVKLSEQGVAARRQSTTYGEWQLVRRSAHVIEVVYRAEYMWIESAIAGAAVGTFDSCGVQASIETKLLDKYNGSTVVRF